MQEEARELTFPSVAMLFLNPDADSWDKGESAEFFSGFWPITEDPACEALWAVSKHSQMLFARVHFLLPDFFFLHLLARLQDLGARFMHFSRKRFSSQNAALCVDLHICLDILFLIFLLYKKK